MAAGQIDQRRQWRTPLRSHVCNSLRGNPDAVVRKPSGIGLIGAATGSVHPLESIRGRLSNVTCSGVSEKNTHRAKPTRVVAAASAALA